MSEAITSARLFLALWPGPTVRARLLVHRDAWIWASTASLVSPERLHLTLHFLGEVPGERLPILQTGLRVPFRPLELRLGYPGLWPNGTAVLEPEAVPARLLELHAALGEALQRLGLSTEARAFRPHITLARRASGATPLADPEQLRWQVGGYALVQSRPEPMGEYTVLVRYSADGAVSSRYRLTTG